MIPYSKRTVPAPLFAEAVELELGVAAALAGEELGLVCVPTKSTLRFEIGKDWEVSVRVIPLPFIQTPEVPAALGVKMTPAHYGQPASLEMRLDRG